jgi:ATP-dependent RNA helicase SUPV3L1/SUV3
MPAPSELPNALVQLLLEKVEGWTTSADVSRTFHAFGISEQHQKPLFDAFTAVVHEKKAFASRFWDIRRMQALWEDLASPADTTAHAAISRVFFAFAADPASAPHLKSASPAVLGSIRAIHEAADVSHPHEHYPSARRMRRRIIMHVGPTNSGKTHHALRALAAARSGVYAGPLRLLAHEIWARLNAGQIVPAGVDPDTLPPAMAVPDDQTGFDVSVGSESAVRKDGDPRFARACNMITGEEMRIVEEGAPLLACTIEMMSVEKHVAVAVIDEIQLLGDEQRGGAWTSAVLGVCADEVHLCGEESAVPIVREMLAATGDHLEIRRYERLTPLRVAEKSLNGDLRKVEKGDCVVAFSRTHIFGVKETIEKETGMKCAVAYGALPPEIRSEQAALFNDPDSGYDVLVGSDAVGMGLNLYALRCMSSVHCLTPVQEDQAGRARVGGQVERPGRGPALDLADQANRRTCRPIRAARGRRCGWGRRHSS